MAARELEAVDGDADNEAGVVLDPEPMHVLVLGDEDFICSDKLPRSYFIRYADNPAVMYQQFLLKLVDPDDQDRLWDAFEEIGNDAALDAVNKLVDTYTERPTERSSRSARGSQKTGRK